MDTDFYRMKRLPPYVFAIVNERKMAARKSGVDVVDFGMGNPDRATPQHIVDKLCEAAQRPDTHRYSASQGIPRLRKALCQRYSDRYGVGLDPEDEAIVTIGSKEGLSHLLLATIGPGDVVLAPNPTYPIHAYGVVIAGGDLRSVEIHPDMDADAFFSELERAVREGWPKPKMLILNFPHNPTTTVVDRAFFDRVVAFAKEHSIWVVHDFAYADLTFDGYRAPSFLESPGAKEVGVEFYSLSKSFNMPGWRVGFAAGNSDLINALKRMKSYLDYGIFTPIQVASIIALEGPQDCVEDNRRAYESRRDTLVEGLNDAGWPVAKPQASMFVWAPIPEPFRHMGSLEFTKFLLDEAAVAVSPGIGFGEYGDSYVRFGLVENEHRTRQAIRNIRRLMRTHAPAAVGSDQS
ncbi:alanine transaminase [Thiohalorhabdus sp.]|uniref:alanine transaminase n=1 Tax=Thiohalorhabdus sp. TaxID=3094134 RepID=UPI002FC320EB